MGQHKIIFGNGDQEISFAPTTRVPSSTFIIEDFEGQSSGSSDRILAQGNATLDPLDTTTDVASGLGQADSKKIFVASTANVTSSHRYVISHVDDGAHELFTVAGIAGDNYILAETPLLRSYPTGSAVQGIRFTATFPAASANNLTLMQIEDPVRVIWQYTLSGSTHRQPELITILRTDLDDSDVDSVQVMVEQYWPDFATRFNSSNEMRNAVAFAKGYIRSRLKGKLTQPEEFMMGEQGKYLLFWRTMYHFAQQGNTPGNVDGIEFKFDMKTEFDAIWNDLNTGKPGTEVVEVDRLEDTAKSNAAVKRRSIIGSL